MNAAQGTAVWFAGPRHVELRSAPLPALGPNEIAVRALFSAISHGTEMLAYRGEIDPALALDLPTFDGSFRYPLKYGYACTGSVEKVGQQITSLQPGDLVFALHPHQDRFVIDQSLAAKLPDGLDPGLGVFFAQLETAVNVLLDSAPRIQETVVIFGQGIVGLLITSLLARLDLKHIIAVDPLSTRREAALLMGATHTVNPREDVAELVRSLTAARGADCVIEVSGAPAALNPAIECAAVQADVVVASWYGQKSLTLQLGTAFHRRRLRLVSSQVGMLNPALTPRWDRARRTETVRSLLPQLKLVDLPTKRMPFREAARAYEMIDSGSEELIQMILTYDDSGNSSG